MNQAQDKTVRENIYWGAVSNGVMLAIEQKEHLASVKKSFTRPFNLRRVMDIAEQDDQVVLYSVIHKDVNHFYDLYAGFMQDMRPQLIQETIFKPEDLKPQPSLRKYRFADYDHSSVQKYEGKYILLSDYKRAAMEKLYGAAVSEDAEFPFACGLKKGRCHTTNRQRDDGSWALAPRKIGGWDACRPYYEG
jgi:hypothetical protein